MLVWWWVGRGRREGGEVGGSAWVEGSRGRNRMIETYF